VWGGGLGSRAHPPTPKPPIPNPQSPIPKYYYKIYLKKYIKLIFKK